MSKVVCKTPMSFWGPTEVDRDSLREIQAHLLMGKMTRAHIQVLDGILSGLCTGKLEVIK